MVKQFFLVRCFATCSFVFTRLEVLGSKLVSLKQPIQINSKRSGNMTHLGLLPVMFIFNDHLVVFKHKHFEHVLEMSMLGGTGNGMCLPKARMNVRSVVSWEGVDMDNTFPYILRRLTIQSKMVYALVLG